MSIHLTPDELLNTYIKIVTKACLTKKTEIEVKHCQQVAWCAQTILNLGIPNPKFDPVELEQLKLDCTVNDAKRSKECLKAFDILFMNAFESNGLDLEKLASKYKK